MKSRALKLFSGVLTAVLLYTTTSCLGNVTDSLSNNLATVDLAPAHTPNNDNYPEMTAILSLLFGSQTVPQPKHIFGSIGMPTWEPVFSNTDDIGESSIAVWKYGKKTSLTVSYDDSAIGNALHGIPRMAQKNLVGTWLVNPGTSTFQKMSGVWHNAVEVYHQEIANHTWEHQGGSTEEEIALAMGGASEYIKEHIYKLDPQSHKLLGFNKGGGTSWGIPTTGEAWDERVRNNYLIERKYSTGFYKAMPFEEMRMVVLGASLAPAWSSIHFHGICDDDNNGNINPAYYPSYIETCTCSHIPPESVTEPPFGTTAWIDWAGNRFQSGYDKALTIQDCKDGGTGAVKKTEIYKFYDYLKDENEIPAQQIWIDGFIAIKKYEIERTSATISIEEANSSRIRLNLTIPLINLPSPLNQKNLYEEELTIFTKVPDNWTACRVTQSGQSYTYRVSNGETRFEALPDGGPITLVNDSVANVNIPYIGHPLP